MKRIIPQNTSPSQEQTTDSEKTKAQKDESKLPGGEESEKEGKKGGGGNEFKEDMSGLYIDVLEYVDIGCNGFVTNISLVISTYQNLFMKT